MKTLAAPALAFAMTVQAALAPLALADFETEFENHGRRELDQFAARPARAERQRALRNHRPSCQLSPEDTQARWAIAFNRKASLRVEYAGLLERLRQAQEDLEAITDSYILSSGFSALSSVCLLVGTSAWLAQAYFGAGTVLATGSGIQILAPQTVGLAANQVWVGGGYAIAGLQIPRVVLQGTQLHLMTGTRVGATVIDLIYVFVPSLAHAFLPGASARSEGLDLSRYHRSITRSRYLSAEASEFLSDPAPRWNSPDLTEVIEQQQLAAARSRLEQFYQHARQILDDPRRDWWLRNLLDAFWRDQGSRAAVVVAHYSQQLSLLTMQYAYWRDLQNLLEQDACACGSSARCR